MKTIWKYGIIPGRCDVQMPLGSKVLSAGLDPIGNMCIWVEVDTENPIMNYNVLGIGTGWEITVDLSEFKFIDTVTHGDFVWHIYVEDKGEDQWKL